MTPAGSPLRSLKGVGPALERTLSEAGVRTVEDLLWLVPARYEDRSNPTPIGSLGFDSGTVTVCGRVVALQERQARVRRLRLTEGVVSDDTGSIAVVWFNQPFLRTSLRVGMRVWLYGPVRPAPRGWGLQLQSPEWEVEEDDEEAPLHIGRVVPIYRRIGRLGPRRLRALVARAVETMADRPEHLPAEVVAELGLPPLDTALRGVHFPELGEGPAAAAALAALATRRSLAHRRLALEELAGLAVVLERERLRRRAVRAPVCTVTDEVREAARQLLPFKLTGAQRRVVAEIVADLQRPEPMARLLQGDVGSGKTVVATLAALVALEAGLQVALLAPTELLAQQHHATLSRLLAHTRHVPALLIGSLPARQKSSVREAVAEGRQNLVIGTHALIEETVRFPRLGLVVIDEQHRFGVAQRQALVDKGTAPHLLVMTATPIPRSLALSVYGDLDVSVLDELPPGRTPVTTVLRDDAARPRLVEFLRREVAQGGQAYWVFPLIEESEAISARAVETHVQTVQAALPGITVEVVHGRVSAAEREDVMGRFARGEVAVLCATTVIEVGVDVPNASVIVIENAERFGLAQLHQLRGRVGRGRRRSFCVLLTGPDCPPEAAQRLGFFASTTDGFRIAEEDFRMRGPGELTGLRQWGRPEFAVASLWLHQRELAAARDMARHAAAAGRLEALAASLRCPRGAAAEVGAA
ncbi:MAG TPA: ATP-dependent DNA helicase RecG [Thermoanaerobaculaceae bacterium]|nr:ATP-dependent DNA helicase RecG [Thermoanaerobaculaceae bacterium]HRS16802.1 ATP-dependent DNA helicase RecG [Thermoanaerobaculaceae bacterium]